MDRRLAGDAHFMGIVYHADTEREYAYDRNTHLGKLDKAPDEARKRNWTVGGMRADWKLLDFGPTRSSGLT
jgi:hypothetical protein